MEFTEVTIGIHYLVKQEWIGNIVRLPRKQLKNQLCFYSFLSYPCYLLAEIINKVKQFIFHWILLIENKILFDGPLGARKS